MMLIHVDDDDSDGDLCKGSLKKPFKNGKKHGSKQNNSFCFRDATPDRIAKQRSTQSKWPPIARPPQTVLKC